MGEYDEIYPRAGDIVNLARDASDVEIEAAARYIMDVIRHRKGEIPLPTFQLPRR